DALDRGCRIIQFEGATGFGDSLYRDSGAFVTVDYANPQAAASAILDLPRKLPAASYEPTPKAPVFDKIRQALRRRLESQRYFVRGASQIDVPILFSTEETDRDFRVREREKMLRYRRRLVWRDLDEVKTELAQSDNWIHRNVRLTPYVTTESAKVPRFSMHIHAFYTDQLHDDLKRYRAYHLANRIVVTTDTGTKADDIRKIMAKEGLTPEVLLVPNRGRDILPFMELFHADGAAGDDDIWCHLHQKKSLGTTSSGDVWRTFLMRILLGNESELSGALTAIGQKRVGFVSPFDPYHIPWNGARALLPKFARVLPGPMPDNPLLFPVGNMFWVRRSVVLAMNDVFGSTYPWPNEPIANDGTEFHLIERLWPAMTTHLGLESLFMHKLDEKRV
ncbi:MAG: rhamnan synthesis F family protein, partial [Gemmobacter sp.]|nr:rhamnan synthesis F family protein [Gemmobacter sp.]